MADSQPTAETILLNAMRRIARKKRTGTYAFEILSATSANDIASQALLDYFEVKAKINAG